MLLDLRTLIADDQSPIFHIFATLSVSARAGAELQREIAAIDKRTLPPGIKLLLAETLAVLQSEPGIAIMAEKGRRVSAGAPTE